MMGNYDGIRGRRTVRGKGRGKTGKDKEDGKGGRRRRTGKREEEGSEKGDGEG